MNLAHGILKEKSQQNVLEIVEQLYQKESSIFFTETLLFESTLQPMLMRLLPRLGMRCGAWRSSVKFS